MTINLANSELELDFHAGEKLTSRLTRVAGLFAVLDGGHVSGAEWAKTWES